MKLFFRILLLPFSLLYGGIIFIRNKLYDLKIFKSTSFDVPVISVGNLSAGGAGKTPMAEYLISLLQKKNQPAFLSRGYRRKTTGFILATLNSGFEEIGDEASQVKNKFPAITVAVSENRVNGISQLLADAPQTDVIILDDAFQHRAVKPALSILVTPFHHPFYNDALLPAGRLRENKSGYKRADIIVVTKCPHDLSNTARLEIEKKIKPLASQQLFFSKITYNECYSLLKPENKFSFSENEKLSVLFISGIADPEPIENYLTKLNVSFKTIQFPDHHIFSENDLNEIGEQFSLIQSDEKIILTTEKDAVRLSSWRSKIEERKWALYILPMKMKFFTDDEIQFHNSIFEFMNHNTAR
jgi:tetraacyldisaccharide 4'-kinase